MFIEWGLNEYPDFPKAIDYPEGLSSKINRALQAEQENSDGRAFPIEGLAQKIIQECYAYDPKNEREALCRDFWFAGASKVTPLLPTYISYYLIQLQKRIWKGNPPPSGRYFTSHDLRRICATYLKLKGLSNEEIADRLGHEDLASQYTYTLTAGNDVLDALQDVSKQGLYGIQADENKNTIASVTEDVKVLSEESFFNKASMVIDVVEDEENAKSFIDKLLQEMNDVDFPTEQSQPDGEIPNGFPMRTHNCNAHERVTCFHHTLKCYKCKKYSPDEDMLLEHKVELVRWVVFVHHQETLLKKTKDRVEKRTASRKDRRH
ncbi:UNVERIFIED_ORG: hypothetical protein ABIC97_003610 [Peribacillus simplex]